MASLPSLSSNSFAGSRAPLLQHKSQSVSMFKEVSAAQLAAEKAARQLAELQRDEQAAARLALLTERTAHIQKQRQRQLETVEIYIAQLCRVRQQTATDDEKERLRRLANDALVNVRAAQSVVQCTHDEVNKAAQQSATAAAAVNEKLVQEQQQVNDQQPPQGSTTELKQAEPEAALAQPLLDPSATGTDTIPAVAPETSENLCTHNEASKPAQQSATAASAVNENLAQEQRQVQDQQPLQVRTTEAMPLSLPSEPAVPPSVIAQQGIDSLQRIVDDICRLASISRNELDRMLRRLWDVLVSIGSLVQSAHENIEMASRMQQGDETARDNWRVVQRALSKSVDTTSLALAGASITASAGLGAAAILTTTAAAVEVAPVIAVGSGAAMIMPSTAALVAIAGSAPIGLVVGAGVCAVAGVSLIGLAGYRTVKKLTRRDE